MQNNVSIIVALLLALFANPGQSAEEKFTLKNGLEVILRPVFGSDNVAATVLYNIGCDHDPKGKSGLTHLIEHLYVTAAAGKTSARDIQTFVSNYPAGWNAQTGSAYTVIATVFPQEKIDQELADAAARMENLNVTVADIEREKPRIVDELANMFERMPQLAAANRAREKARPSPNGGRKGGIPEQINSITLEELEGTLNRFYKPINAILVLAGEFKTSEARQMVEKHFSKIPPGEKCPPAKPVQADVKGGFEKINVRPIQASMPGFVAVSVKVPLPNDPDYPAFLILAQRLLTSSSKLPATQGFFPVNYAILDDPEILTLSLPLQAGESPEKVLERLNVFIDETLDRQFQRIEIQTTKMMYGFFLGITDWPDQAALQNLYGLAFSIGRCLQLGLDSEQLSSAMDKITAEDVEKVKNKYFSPISRAAVAVLPK
jgi:zinc protease